MTRQLRLDFKRPDRFARADFAIGPSNLRAVDALDAWADWHNGCLALIGPEGAGKTHLARAWALEVGALVAERHGADLDSAAGRPVLIEDVDRGVDEETLFHLINMAARPGGALLLTARTPPLTWSARLPDLRSRLNALSVVEIEEPDDAVLEGALRKFFRERSIRAPADVYPYLLRRMERSIPAARDLVEQLDDAADQEQRPISRALARQIMGGDNENFEVFED